MDAVAVPGLIQEIRKYGTFDANACLNCGSCSVVCSLSGDHASFPRKPIQLALMGLKTPLLRSLEPWLCYDCGDCSLACPRQAEPRESMMTLRRYLAGAYDITRLSSKILSSKGWEIASLVFVGVLVFALAFSYHLYYVHLSVGDLVSTPMGVEHMFNTIIYFTYVVFLIPIFILASKAIRMHQFTMHDREAKVPLRFYFFQAKTMLAHLLFQMNIRKCTEPSNKKRWAEHWLIGLAFASKCFIVIFLLKWFQTDSIYPLYNPQRWVGYLIAAVLIAFSSQILASRIRRRKLMYKFSEFSDLSLPIMLLLVAVSGIILHIFRYLEFSMASHYAYALHLALAVSLVVVELPFGKLSHVIIRPLALYFQAVKESALAEAGHSIATVPSKELTIEGARAS